MAKEKIGTISHYYSHLGVAVVALKGNLKVGDNIVIEGEHVSFEQKVESMQIDKDNIDKAKAGQEIGLKVDQKVHGNCVVFKID